MRVKKKKPNLFSCYCDVFQKDLISVTFTALFCGGVSFFFFFTICATLKVLEKILLQFNLYYMEEKLDLV